MVEQVDIEKVLTELKRVAATALNEEEFKINAERILYNEVISKLGLQPGRYEYTFISGGRLDALYGHVLIEYKAPGKLSKPPDIARAKEQLIGYIGKEAEVEERYRLFLGVIISDRIAFVRYDSKVQDWVMRGPYDLNRETVLRLIEAMRGLRRKKLAVDELLRDFGPRSQITRKAVKVFYDKVTESRSSKVEALFNDWKRIFSQVCAYSPEKLKGLEVYYGIGDPVDYNALLFSIHTHCALIMKLLGAEVAYLYGTGKWLKSYVTELEDAHMKGLDALLSALRDLESGGVFRKLLNITNFIEGDYFSWYLEELDEELAEIIAEMAKKLADYEPATPILEPEYTRDLLKRLYQNLVPKKIRHDLGEYYTPDWLADLVLNEVGITVENLEKLSQEKNDSLAPFNLRVLDPACGSGTFLILTMKRFREYAEEHYLRDVLADYLLRNFVGFDLNPMAVLAARTNYLLAVADLLPYVKGSTEIPIYLSDSLLVETRTTLTGTSYVIKTYVGEFQMPKSIVENGLLGRLLEAIDRYVRLRYRVEDFEQVVKDELNLDEVELQLTRDLYRTFLKLEEEGKNHVWTSIIKNAFAPLTTVSSVGKFDYVIGNPPWVLWDSLPEGYRSGLEPLLRHYIIWKPAERLGGSKVDISIPFTYVCLDRYLKDGGAFGFLITQSVFKTKGAGERFRQFKIRGSPVKVLEVHDLVEIKPFEGANNRTAAIFVKKEGKTIYPVKYTKWMKKEAVDQDNSLEDAFRKSKIIEMVATPSDERNELSPWITTPETTVNAMRKVCGKSYYRGYEGINSGGANAVYWMNILDVVSEKELEIVVPAHLWKFFGKSITKIREIMVENITKGMKKKVKKVKTVIEDFFIFPMIKTRHLNKWMLKGYIYTLQMHDPVKGIGYDERWMKINFPETYSHLKGFEDVLRKRRSGVVRQLMKKGPFYSMYAVRGYTFASYKVVWNQMGSRLVATVVSKMDDPYVGNKMVIPEHVLAFIPTEDENEAHYICAILNSSVVDFILRSIAGGTKSFGTPRIIENTIKIRKFNPNDLVHRKLSECSKNAHELATKGDNKGLKRVEEELESLVAQLYDLTDEGLKEIKKSLAILRGEEVEEDEVEEEPKEVKVDFLDAVVRPNVVGSFEVAVSNPLKEKVTIELQLPKRPFKIETDKEEDKIRVAVPPLEAGVYKVPYKIITSEEVVEDNFTLYVKEEERYRAREALASKLDELLDE